MTRSAAALALANRLEYLAKSRAGLKAIARYDINTTNSPAERSLAITKFAPYHNTKAVAIATRKSTIRPRPASSFLPLTSWSKDRLLCLTNALKNISFSESAWTSLIDPIDSVAVDAMVPSLFLCLRARSLIWRDFLIEDK